MAPLSPRPSYVRHPGAPSPPEVWQGLRDDLRVLLVGVFTGSRYRAGRTERVPSRHRGRPRTTSRDPLGLFSGWPRPPSKPPARPPLPVPWLFRLLRVGPVDDRARTGVTRRPSRSSSSLFRSRPAGATPRVMLHLSGVPCHSPGARVSHEGLHGLRRHAERRYVIHLRREYLHEPTPRVENVRGAVGSGCARRAPVSPRPTVSPTSRDGRDCASPYIDGLTKPPHRTRTSRTCLGQTGGCSAVDRHHP